MIIKFIKLVSVAILSFGKAVVIQKVMEGKIYFNYAYRKTNKYIK